VRAAHGTPDKGNGAPCYGAGRRGQKGFEMIQNLKGSNEFKSFQTLTDLKSTFLGSENLK
jgi:hypothetical protein